MYARALSSVISLWNPTKGIERTVVEALLELAVEVANPTKGIERFSFSIGGGINFNRNPTKGIERSRVLGLCLQAPLLEPNKGN